MAPKKLRKLNLSRQTVKDLSKESLEKMTGGAFSGYGVTYTSYGGKPFIPR